MLLVFNSLMKSRHSNKKAWFGDSHVIDDIIILDVTWEDMFWQMLSCCGLSFFTSAEREVKDLRRSGMYESTIFDKIGQAKSVVFLFYSAIWRSASRISSRYLEITSISLIYSLTFSRKKELLFWLSRGLNRLTCVTCQIRGDSKLRD